MNKRILTAIFLLTMILTAIILTACRKEMPMRPIENVSREKLGYAHSMNFVFRVFYEGEFHQNIGGFLVYWQIIRNEDGFFVVNPFYTDLIFVHNEAQALEFPDNVITAWPRDEDGWSERFVNAINWTIENPLIHNERQARETFTLEDFGLTYPLTIDDIIYNWENVNRMWRAFDYGETTFIHYHAIHSSRAFWDIDEKPTDTDILQPENDLQEEANQ